MNRSALLTAPLLLFLLLTFLAPIAAFLWRGVSDADVGPVLPRTVAALATWDGTALPPEPAFAALVADLRDARASDRGDGANVTGRPAGSGYCWATTTVTSIASAPPPRETPRIGAACCASRPEPRRM